MKLSNTLLLSIVVALTVTPVFAKTVKVELTVMEKDIVVDNEGAVQHMWTYNGELPGPLVRVKQGDSVDFVLTNHKDNKQSHSIDFHAAKFDVLDEFESIKLSTPPPKVRFSAF